MTQPKADERSTNKSSVSSVPSGQSIPDNFEQALISVILNAGITGKGNQRFAETVDATRITYADFTQASHQAIWGLMEILYNSGDSIDMLTVWDAIERNEKAVKHVSKDYLAYLLARPVTLNHRQYAERIVDASLSIGLKKVAQDISQIADNRSMNIQEKLRRARRKMTDVFERSESISNANTTWMSQGVQDIIASYQHAPEDDYMPGIPTGFHRLDDAMLGWRKERLYGVVGIPGSGKSNFLLNTAVHAVMAGQRVLIIELEMSREETVERILCAFAGIDSDRFKRRRLHGFEVSRLPIAQKRIAEYDKHNQFKLVTMNLPTLQELDMKIDSMLMSGYDLVVIDYLGGAVIANDAKNPDDVQHHGKIYQKASYWKKQYGIPFVVGIQPNSSAQKVSHEGAYRNDMIFSSKDFEKGADFIMFLHPAQDDPKKGKQNNPENRTSFVITKNRGGKAANSVIHAKAEFNLNRFVEWTSHSPITPQPMWDMKLNKPNLEDL